MGSTVTVTLLCKIQNHHLVTFVAWVSRGVQAILQVLMLSILTQILDVNDYAVFILISSLLVWFMLTDLGLGFALQNKISKLKAKGKDYEKFIVNVFLNGFFIVFLFVIVSLILSYTLIPEYLEKYTKDQNYHYEFLLSAILMVCIGVFGMVYKVWYALGKGYWSSILPAIGTLITYLLLQVLLEFNIQSLLIVFFVYFFPLAFLPLFFFIKTLINLRKKITFDVEYIASLLKSAKGFLFFGFMSALVLNVDFFIASQFLPPNQIVQYHTLLKLFTFGLFLYSAYLMAVWPIFSEKIENRQSQFIVEMLKSFIPVGMVFIIVFTLLLVFFGSHIYTYLIKNMDFEVSKAIVVMFGLYFLIRVWTDTFAMVLQSGNNLKPLLKSVPIQAVLSISLQIILVSYFQIYGLLLALILSFLLTVAWYLPYSSSKFLKENSGHAH